MQKHDGLGQKICKFFSFQISYVMNKLLLQPEVQLSNVQFRILFSAYEEPNRLLHP